MLFGTMYESQIDAVISIPDITCESFEFIRECFYGLNPSITNNNCVDIMHTSDKYILNEIKKE